MNIDESHAAQTLWDYHCMYDDLTEMDVIVGLGSYDIRVAERCAELYHEGYGGRIVFTGATGNWTRGRFSASEARTFATQAIALGVPADAVLLEEQATNIGENIRFSSALLGGEDPRWIFVTKPQTQRRCRATLDVCLANSRSSVTAPVHDLLQQPTPEHTYSDLLGEMVGDLFRILSYPARGFQSPQTVPEPVRKSYELLVAAGYTNHLPEKDLR